MTGRTVGIGLIIILISSAAIGYTTRTQNAHHETNSCVIPADGSTGAYCEPDKKAAIHDTSSTPHGENHNQGVPQNERAFIEGMIPHHQEAVDAASEVLARGGTTPAIKALATAIITAQEAEITKMKRWYETWYGSPYVGALANEHAMMRDLSALNGLALDRAFLEDMIPHHSGAIAMATTIAPHIEHEEIRILVDAITKTQTAEIIQIRQLLETLPQ